MNAISPGDFVECVQNRLPTTLPPIGLVVGRVYVVEALGVAPLEDVNPGVPWVRLQGVAPGKGKLGYRLEWFRPVYRPKAETFRSMLEPKVMAYGEVSWSVYRGRA